MWKPKVREMKMRRDLGPGDMIIYPYAWSVSPGYAGQTLLKPRPCVILYRAETGRGPVISICAITTTPVEDWNRRVVVPSEERALVGMSAARRQSVCVNECNIERLDDSATLPEQLPVLTFSSPFTEELRRRFRNLYERKLVRHVQRPVEAPVSEAESDCVGLEP